jgi:hypothetical protein
MTTLVTDPVGDRLRAPHLVRFAYQRTVGYLLSRVGT